jgi:cytochrome c oxidase assembly factor CtaG
MPRRAHRQGPECLTSPLDDLVNQMLSAHMVQHLLLMLLAASLPVWVRPMPAAGGCQRVPTANDGR